MTCDHSTVTTPYCPQCGEAMGDGVFAILRGIIRAHRANAKGFLSHAARAEEDGVEGVDAARKTEYVRKQHASAEKSTLRADAVEKAMNALLRETKTQAPGIRSK